MDSPSIKLHAHIPVGGSEWAALKMWAERERSILVQKLVQAKTHDQSNELRGAIKFIDSLLAVEKDAAIAASRQGHR